MSPLPASSGTQPYSVSPSAETQQRASGLSAPQFCKQEKIGYASFCNWRKRLSDQAAGDSADSGEAGFLDLSSLMSLMGAAQSGPGWNIVLSLGNGVELRLSQNG